MQNLTAHIIHALPHRYNRDIKRSETFLETVLPLKIHGLGTRTRNVFTIVEFHHSRNDHYVNQKLVYMVEPYNYTLGWLVS